MTRIREVYLSMERISQILAIVTQEPALYSGTIKENILLGISDEYIEEESVMEACKKANIYNFIVSSFATTFLR
jgi:ATP-binding cassette subfamily B (MDR/TAP) protein 1